MSGHSDDQKAVQELSRMAKMYMARGMTEKAEEILLLVDAINKRVRKEQRSAERGSSGSA